MKYTATLAVRIVLAVLMKMPLTAQNAKKNTNSTKDFKYEVLIKMENGKCDGGVGFRQSLPMEGIEVDSNAEMLEDDLNENFAGRKAIMDFNINKKDGKKMVFSLKFE